MVDQALHILKKQFGYQQFRAGQREVIDNITNQRDTLAIMPTGGGKSICYQIPALIFKGLTIVVSPLISLMKDQVDALQQMGIKTACINSSLKVKEYRNAIQGIESGAFDLIYVAPERLSNEDFLEAIEHIDIDQVAIDEAHCISHWGHDFRKSYLRIPSFIQRLKKRPVISAFTATATPRVREDIVQHLKIKPDRFITGFDRENLTFLIEKGVDNLTYIKRYLKLNKGKCGIIYATTRKEVDRLYGALSELKYSVGRYHAGLGDRERESQQNAFLNEDIEIVVATNAFGMGIDKSNVRFVIHANLPGDLESYYQEAGRAGRDGLPGDAILIFQPKDIQIQRFLIENSEFETGEAILKIKYEKLNQIVNYCHTSGCIRSYILEYFGEPPIEGCGNCVNCLDDRDEEDITTEAQKILSCILRTKQRYGVNTIVGVLAGSENRNILKFNLHHESTYGLLSHYNQKKIRNLMDLMVGDGYLEVTNGTYPVVTVTTKGVMFLKERKQLFRKVTKVRKVKQLSGDTVLFEKLRQLRSIIARELGKAPYTVFSDATLWAISREKPTNQDDMLNIPGVGGYKYAQYGARVIKVIQGH